MRYAEVIGCPVGHSKSPLIHRFWLGMLALPGTYASMEVGPDGIGAYLAGRRSDPDWLGCNVTMPLKSAAIRLVDELSSAAAATGAINLIVREDPLLIGHNVDPEGFLAGLGASVSALECRHALVVGTGGAAAAIAFALAGQGFRVDVLARDQDKARALLRPLGATGGRALPLERELPLLETPVLLVNATPLGMRGFPALGLDLSMLPRGSIVHDIVYDPLETGLLAEARRLGLEAIDGLEMLIGQAALSFALLFKAAPPRRHDRDLRKCLAR